MSRLLKSRGLMLAVLIAAFSAASLDVRGDGYLRCIGPAPLRFALAKPINPQPLVSFSVPVNAHPERPIEPTVPSVTNQVQNVAKDVVSVAHSDESITNSVTTPKAEFVPADNLLTITPTMLNEYFKPVGGGTNQAPATVVVLPDQMNFQPPIPKDLPSSSATYKSE